MNLSELIQQQFKIKTRTVINPLLSSVGTSAVKMLENNPNRLAFVIVNMSVNTLYLGFDNDVSSTKGILLSPNGGTASMIWSEDFEMTGYEVYGKASGAASAIYVIEILSTE